MNRFYPPVASSPLRLMVLLRVLSVPASVVTVFTKTTKTITG